MTTYAEKVEGVASLQAFWRLNEAAGTEAKDTKTTTPGTYAGVTLKQERPAGEGFTAAAFSTLFAPEYLSLSLTAPTELQKTEFLDTTKVTKFNGSNAFGEAAQPTSRITAPFTIEFWFKTEAGTVSSRLAGADNLIDLYCPQVSLITAGAFLSWAVGNELVGFLNSSMQVKPVGGINEEWHHAALVGDANFQALYLFFVTH